MSIVSVVRTNGDAENDIDAAVRKAVELAGGIGDIVRKGSIVLI
jgi:uncharacterized protein (DUF362 family)